MPAFPDRSKRWWPPLAVATIAFAASAYARAPEARASFTEGPPPAHTGGFGEPTCSQCHFDQPVDDSAGTLSILGVSAAVSPGERHRLTIVLARPGIGAGGFQLSARWAGGSRAGEQAGRMRALNERVRVVEESGRAIQYAQHTAPGSRLAKTDSIAWTVEWIAPGGGGDVVFHVAANAANGDDSELGDYIYTRRTDIRVRSEKED